jgi:H+-translocating NAD(P) transhydrogenase subunit alpha
MTEGLVIGVVIFTLATFLGYELITRVPPTLHTPLMSGANAISGITIVGALVVAGGGLGWISTVLGFSRSSSR